MNKKTNNLVENNPNIIKEEPNINSDKKKKGNEVLRKKIFDDTQWKIITAVIGIALVCFVIFNFLH